MFRYLLTVLFMLLAISNPCLVSSAAAPEEPVPEKTESKSYSSIRIKRAAN